MASPHMKIRIVVQLHIRGLDTSSPYPISGVDVGAEGEEGEDFLEIAPFGG